jgi:hypothetical protein
MHMPEQFAHVLLFRCPACSRPLASACASDAVNLEPADAHWFTPRCHCGWSGDVIGITAIKHWVEPWKTAAPVRNGQAGACDDPLRM